MKTYFLIFALLLLSGILKSQESQNGAVVAATNMNVLYRGIENPVEIAVPGVKSDKVTATITNGTITRSAKGWIANPGDQPESVITVLADNKKVSEKTFRIKSVPAPTAKFAGITEGELSKDAAMKTDKIDVELQDFIWDLKFVVKSFTLSWEKNNYDISETSASNMLTDKMKSAISASVPGQKFYIEKIVATGPDGRDMNLAPILFKIR